jgi:hypothetical protein
MKKLVLAAGLGLMFASCGLIPPIPVDDMLGMDNVESAEVDLAGQNNLIVQAATGNINATYTFADISALTSLPTVPSSVSIRLTARGIRFLPGCTLATGSTKFTLSNIQVTLANGGSPAATTTFQFNDLSFIGTLAGVTYTASDVLGGEVKVETLNIASIIDILKNPGTGQNTITVSATISAASDTLKGCRVVFKYGKAAGSVRL